MRKSGGAPQETVMSATIIDGKAIARDIQREVAQRIRARAARGALSNENMNLNGGGVWW